MITTATQGLAHMTCKVGCSSQECYDAARLVAEAVECARVVGVLDAWAKLNPRFSWRVYARGALGAEALCDLLHDSDHVGSFLAAAPDAARAAAAKAIEAGELG